MKSIVVLVLNTMSNQKLSKLRNPLDMKVRKTNGKRRALCKILQDHQKLKCHPRPKLKMM